MSDGATGRFCTYLDCWRVEETPDNILASAVGREMERGEAALAREFAHEARSSDRGYLYKETEIDFLEDPSLTSDLTLGGTCLMSSLTMSSSP